MCSSDLDILCPDGTVTGSFGQFKNQDLWLESMRLARHPDGWSDEPSPTHGAAAPVAPVYATTSDASVTVSDGAAPSITKITLDGNAIRRARPDSEMKRETKPNRESKAAGLQRRRAIRRARARAG